MELNQSHSLGIANIVNLAKKLDHEIELEYKIDTVYPNGEKYRGRIDIVLMKNKVPFAFIEVERPTFIDKKISKSLGTPNPKGYIKHKPSYELSLLKIK